MATRRSKKLRRADQFRSIVFTLRDRTDVDWRHYEEKFIDTQVRRPEDYIFTEPQWSVLRRLTAAATTFSKYSGAPVVELVATTYHFRFELVECGEEFVTKHYKARTIELPVRELRYLVRLYRSRHFIETDETVEATFRATWQEYSPGREEDEYSVYSQLG